MSNAIEMLKNNDTGLLRPDQVDEFRQYLVDTGCKVRKGNNSGQLLFVSTAGGWAPVQKGANDTVKTPYALRSVIDDFLKTPVARSMTLARRINASKQIPLNSDKPSVGIHTHTLTIDSDKPGYSFHETGEPTPGSHHQDLRITQFVVGNDGAESLRTFGTKQTCEAGTMYHDPSARCVPQGSTTERPANFHILPEDGLLVSLASQRLAMHADSTRRQQWAAFGDLVKQLDAMEKDAGPHIILSPRLRELAMQGGLMITEGNPFASAPVADPQHLEDLRDDFAIHCPLTQLEDESLTAFADRRWQYADMMMKRRTTQYAD